MAVFLPSLTRRLERFPSFRQIIGASRISSGAIHSLMFPWNCPGCQSLLPFPRVVCDGCETLFRKLEPPWCRKCGTPLPREWLVEICPECQLTKSAMTAVRSAFYYEKLAQQMIREIKYRGKARNARYFAERLLVLFLAEFSGYRIDAVTPVPLHYKREWQRRFNQAELIGRMIAPLLGIPLWPRLVKARETAPQSLLSGAARRRNVAGSFSIAGQQSAPLSVLLIDDVITTGATLEECARTLRVAGARRVYALTVARSVLR